MERYFYIALIFIGFPLIAAFLSQRLARLGVNKGVSKFIVSTLGVIAFSFFWLVFRR
ncbi:MAG: hypothetical protein KGZ79_04235 [Dethiobacter sp.]|jgi:hypothetical protein|nr:hypothetical protein [Dethiobacter sp.]